MTIEPDKLEPYEKGTATQAHSEVEDGSDTTVEAAGVQRQIYRRMPPQRKLEIVEDANRTARLLALSGLRHRHPEAAEEELHLRLFHLVLGSDLATRVYGPLPVEEA